MFIFDLFLIPMRVAVGWLNLISIANIPFSAFLVGGVILILILNFLRGGSND